ncbi:MAG: glycosyltransferase family 2 protein [Bacteroidetes bacterium]|nr:glycosyltransferase family 2 protein [Bacteroidota bacterium]
MQTWSVGILCYNEAGTIRQVIQDTVAVLQQLSPAGNQVIVVDDCSTDGSLEIIQNCIAEFPNIELVHHEVNKGIGAGLRAIYSGAKLENVVAICGDGQFDVQELLSKPEFSYAEFLSFYRLQNTQYNGFRNFLSYFNKWFNRFLLRIDLKDVNWVKAYKTQIVQKLELQLTSSLVESEICSKLIHAGAKPLQFESKYLPRVYGVSKGSSFAIVKKAILDLWSLFRVVKRFDRNRNFSL